MTLAYIFDLFFDNDVINYTRWQGSLKRWLMYAVLERQSCQSLLMRWLTRSTGIPSSPGCCGIEWPVWRRLKHLPDLAL